MSEDLMRYDKLVDDALRGVVVRVLRRVIEEGLPGDHHFYLSFRTDYPGVSLSDDLRARYPEELTIVLQHQFWDLEVDDETIAVTLSFGGRRQRIVLPLAAVTAFADPSVKFGLQFNDAGAGQPDEDAAARPAKDAAEAPGNAEVKAAESESAATGKTGGEAGAEVVALDAFRKK